jgi:hypothetical protein
MLQAILGIDLLIILLFNIKDIRPQRRIYFCLFALPKAVP